MKRSLLGTVVPVALLAAGPVLAGCSGDGGGLPGRPLAGSSSGAPAPTRGMIKWIGQVCAADAGLQAEQGATRVLALSFIPRDPTRDQIAGFVKVTHEDLVERKKKFRKLGPTAPGKDAGRVVTAYVTALQTAADRTADISQTATGPATADYLLADIPRQVADAVEAAVPKGADLPGLTADDPTLKRAYRKAPDCRDARPLTAHASHTSPAPGANA